MKMPAKKRVARRKKLLDAAGERKMLQRVRQAEMQATSTMEQLKRSEKVAAERIATLEATVESLKDECHGRDMDATKLRNDLHKARNDLHKAYAELGHLQRIACRAGPSPDGDEANCATPEDVWKIRTKWQQENAVELKNLRAQAAELVAVKEGHRATVELLQSEVCDLSMKMFAIHQYSNPAIGLDGKPKPKAEPSNPPKDPEDGA